MVSIQPTKELVLAALKNVQDPELHKDLVTLNMVEDVQVNGNTVRFKIVLTTPACPLREAIGRDARAAVMAIPGVKNVEITFDARVPTSQRQNQKIELPIKNFIAISSGKGGVGKTTVAVNIAVALAQCGAKVGLLDADIYGPNVPTMMGIDTLPAQRQGEKMIPAINYGVKVMSIGFMVQPGQPLVWRGPMLHSAIQQFLSEVEWGDLDYLIIDLPPGTGDVQLSLAQSIPLSGGVIVTLPQAVSIEDASRGLQMFNTLKVPVLGVVENMSYLDLPDGSRMDIFGIGGGEKLARSNGIAFLGTIPIDPSVRIGGDSGKPVVISSPDSPTGKALWTIARQVASQLSITVMAE